MAQSAATNTIHSRKRRISSISAPVHQASNRTMTTTVHAPISANTVITQRPNIRRMKPARNLVNLGGDSAFCYTINFTLALGEFVALQQERPASFQPRK